MNEIINTPSLEEAKKLIKKANHPIIIQAQNDEFNRKIIENGNFDILLSVEFARKKSSFRTIDSGCNEVLARIAAKKSVAFGVDLSALRNLPSIEQAQVLARISQNIKIFRKTSTMLRVINARDKIDAFNLLIFLGASTSQASKAISF